MGLLEHVREGVFGPNFTAGVIDERFGADPVNNNFLQLKEKLSATGILNWIDSAPQANDFLADAAARIEGSWRKWRKNYSDGQVIATIGVGADGHVAGIMPNIDLGAFGNKWAVGYDAGQSNKFPLRITATFEFLRGEVDFAIVYMSGEEKRPALERVLADNGTLAETPARIFREMKNVKIFTDILDHD